MKYIFALFFCLFIFISTSSAQIYPPDQTVRGHTRQDGTHVEPYHRTVPDHDRFNNYSTRDNINPYTGQRGTVDPYRQPDPFSSSSPDHRSRRNWP
jgi:hypothetical protein